MRSNNKLVDKKLPSAVRESSDNVPPLGTLFNEFLIIYPNVSTSSVTETEYVDLEVQVRNGGDL